MSASDEFLTRLKVRRLQVVLAALLAVFGALTASLGCVLTVVGPGSSLGHVVTGIAGGAVLGMAFGWNIGSVCVGVGVVAMCGGLVWAFAVQASAWWGRS